MKTINRLLIAMFLLGSLNTVHSQSSNWRVAFQLSEMSGDFGQGVMIESPSIVKNIFTLKLRGNAYYLNHDLDGKNEWSPYFSGTLGISSQPARVSKSIELYGEGGVVMILPNSEFSASDQEFGGYGLFGFNFLFDPAFSYFIEAGGVGSGAIAELTDNERIYANGFFVQVGFKIHFVKSE